MRIRRPLVACLAVLLCLSVAGLAGCSGKKARAAVKGKVVFNRQPLTAGTVAFVDADGHSGSGAIKSDGTYAVNDAPVGEVTITVYTPTQGAMNMPKTPHKGMPKEFQPPGQEDNKAVRVVPAPEKYAKAQSSPLKFTVEPGEQDHNIELTP